MLLLRLKDWRCIDKDAAAAAVPFSLLQQQQCYRSARCDVIVPHHRRRHGARLVFRYRRLRGLLVTYMMLQPAALHCIALSITTAPPF